LNRFVDEVTITVASGSGGDGCVSFRREKYVPKGGPDGGDGGRGGDVVFLVQENLKTLNHLKKKQHHFAQNGRPGSGKNKKGADGNDAVVPVPPGTVVRNRETGAVVCDLLQTGERFTFLRGGRGGKGNAHFRTARHQTPRFSQPGEPGEESPLKLELNIIADIGFVGLPNAGKSTLLAALTAAHPEVGAYPFTTKIPNLGVMRLFDRDIVLADIPGIIEGASGGAGLGIRFLKHISRTAALAFLIDLSDEQPAKTFDVLLHEVGAFHGALLGKPRIVIGTKTDLDPEGEKLAALRKSCEAAAVVGVSAHTRDGLNELREQFASLAGKRREVEE